jgi:hypothetical protein
MINESIWARLRRYFEFFVWTTVLVFLAFVAFVIFVEYVSDIASPAAVSFAACIGGIVMLSSYLMRLVRPPPATPSATWNKTEIARRSVTNLFAYVMLGLLLIAIGWQSASESSGMPFLPIGLIFGGLVILGRALGRRVSADFRLNERGVDHYLYGFIPWLDVAQIDFFSSNRDAYVLLHMPEAERYFGNLSRLNYLGMTLFSSHGPLAKKNKVGPGNPLFINLFGFVQASSYLFEAMRQLHSAALKQHGRVPTSKFGIKHLDDLSEKIDSVLAKIESTAITDTDAATSALNEYVVASENFQRAVSEYSRKEFRKTLWLAGLGLLLMILLLLARFYFDVD